MAQQMSAGRAVDRVIHGSLPTVGFESPFTGSPQAVGPTRKQQAELGSIYGEIRRT